eukprot:g18189.t2
MLALTQVQAEERDLQNAMELNRDPFPPHAITEAADEDRLQQIQRQSLVEAIRAQLPAFQPVEQQSLEEEDGDDMHESPVVGVRMMGPDGQVRMMRIPSELLSQFVRQGMVSLEKSLRRPNDAEGEDEKEET